MIGCLDPLLQKLYLLLNGADIIRTHNVEATKDAVVIASKIIKITQRLIIDILLS